MLPSLKNAAVLSLIVAFAIATSSIAGAAEKKQSYVKSNYVTASKSTLVLGEGHEVTQEVIMSDIKYSDPDYQTAKNEWVYVHTDSSKVAGSKLGITSTPMKMEAKHMEPLREPQKQLLSPMGRGNPPGKGRINTSVARASLRT
jgi:hypothetical protein